MTTTEQDALLTELTARALEARDTLGESFDLDDVCGEHPELRSALEDALRRELRLPGLRRLAQIQDPLLGQVLGDRYQLESRIGSGAMGVVYRAVDREIGRSVAVKILHGGLLEAQEMQTRFEREAAVLGAIEHEAVVRIYDLGIREDGTPFLVMEEIDGPSLADLLDFASGSSDGGVSLARISEHFEIDLGGETSLLRLAARWTAALAEGLEAAHVRGILHRDVKPSNVRIRANGRAVLLDFGIATLSSGQPLTRTNASLGTPAYMAPEMLGGAKNATASADVYGLAATLYHTVTLQAPYHGTPTEILRDLAVRDPAPVSRLRPGLPRDLRAIVDTGIARETARRYPSAAALAEDLTAFLGYQPVRGRHSTALGRAWRRARRSRLVHGAALVIAVAAVAAAIVVGSTIRRDRSERQFEAAWPAVPACVSVLDLGNRRLTQPAAQQHAIEALDRVVASGFSPVMAYTLRATFRLDQCDLRGAQSDSRAMARASGTALTEALARRYAELEPEARNVEVEGLPEPATPDDFYVLGLHAFRAGDAALGIELLTGPARTANRHATELGLLLMSAEINRSVKAKDWSVVRNLAAKLARETTDFETRTGMRSAGSAHVASMAYLRMGAYGQSLAVALEGIALSEATHVTLQNAARAARALEEYELAIDLAERAVHLAPSHLPLHRELALSLSGGGDAAGARDVLAAAPIGSSAADRVLEIKVGATIELNAGIVALAAGDKARAIKFGSAALEILEPVRDSQSKFLALNSLASSVAAGDETLVFGSLLDLGGSEDDVWAYRIRSIVTFMPNELTAAQTSALRVVLDALAETIEWRAQYAGARAAPKR